MNETSKEFTFVYTHQIGADVYVAEDGEKHIKYDDLVFGKISEVKEYIEKNHVRLAQQRNEADRKQERIEKSRESHNQLTNEDWNMLKGE